MERAKSLGGYLIVATSTDEFNAIKHKEAYHSFEHRKYILEAIRYVDKVIPESTWDQKINDIKNTILILLSWGTIGRDNLIS